MLKGKKSQYDPPTHPGGQLHSKSSDFFSVSEWFYILAEVDVRPFINMKVLNFFIINIEGTFYLIVLFVIEYI